MTTNDNNVNNRTGGFLGNIRYFLERTNNVSRSTYFWNAVTATLSAGQSAIVLLVITRTNGITDAGIFSIAYAVGSLMLFVGQYGLRRYQSSDVLEEFNFPEYLGMRIITCSIMVVISVSYCGYCFLFYHYSTKKLIVVLLVCAEKALQAFADVLHGRMQQCGRLDVGAKAATIRITISTVIYIIMLIITHDLVVSTLVWFVANFIVYLFTSQNVIRNYAVFKPSINKGTITRLAIIGLPLFLSYFLSMYIGNAPKYAIDKYLSDDIQAYYNFIFMPAFAVQLLANFIFNPILNTYAVIWTSNNLKRFKKLVIRQMLVLAGITGLGLIVAATIGIPVLSLIFGVDLTDYKTELCVVMIGGGFLGYVTFFTTVITIIREQNKLLFGYITTAVAALLLSKLFVVRYGMIGAAGLYAILMGILCILFLIIMVMRIRKENVNNSGTIRE